MSIVFRESADRALLSSLDVGLLSVRDRACLRLLYRAGVATADQLATLIFPSRRTALRRLRRLWQLGLLERAPIAPDHGGIPVVYRLSRRGSKRLGYVDTRTGGVSRVRHTLDIVDTVCSLVRSAPGSVQLWLTEPMTGGVLPPEVRPDSIVVVQLAAGSAVLCLEIDEATEHSPTIRARLGGLRARPGRPRRLAPAVGRADRGAPQLAPPRRPLGSAAGAGRPVVGPRPRRPPNRRVRGDDPAGRVVRRGRRRWRPSSRTRVPADARRRSARPAGSASSAPAAPKRPTRRSHETGSPDARRAQPPGRPPAQPGGEARHLNLGTTTAPYPCSARTSSVGPN